MKKLCVAFFLMMLLLSSCDGLSGARGTEEAPLVPVNIACSAAYRSSVTVPIESENSAALSDENREAVIPYPDLAFRASYLNDAPFEGRSIKIWVLENGSEREISSVLYQLPAGKLENQMVGHGFTGLNYVYHPSSGAELQFWCTAE
jgi:hypothetical protein